MYRLNFGKVIGQLFGEESVFRRCFTGKPVLHKAPDLRFSSLLCAELIKIPLHSTTKKKVILELLELLKDMGKITDTDTVYHSIMAREEFMSTGIGDGVAIPQGKTAETKELLCAFGTQPEGIDFKSFDGQPADIFFLVVTPEDEPEFHLMKFLATIFHILKSDKHQKRIREFSSPQDAMAFFAMIDNDGKIREHEGGL